MSWSFALMNGKLAEVYFGQRKNGEPTIQGYCHVKKSEYKSKREQRWIELDTKRYRFTCRKGKYFDLIRKRPVRAGSFLRSRES